MITAILFVLACLAWQGVKDAVRGRRRPTVRLRGSGPREAAECGCEVSDGMVVRPCAAHDAMGRA